ncbi:Vkr family protein [Megaselia abdita]
MKTIFSVLFVVILVFMQKTVDADECFKDGRFNLSRASKNADKIYLLETPRSKPTNAIFKIILEEILNYTNVEIVEIPLQDERDYTSYLHMHNPMYKEPSLRINTAFWSYPDNPVTSNEAVNVGAVTNPGNYGLFYPKKFGYIDFNMLRNPSVFPNFQNTMNPSNFTSNRCLNHTCIPILASDQDLDSDIQKLIDSENLFVEVFWIPNLSEEVYNLYADNKSFIILYWSPSEIINGKIDFAPINVTPHKYYNFEASTIGKYYHQYNSVGALSPDSFFSATEALKIFNVPKEMLFEMFKNEENLTDFEMSCEMAKRIVNQRSYDLGTILPDSNITMFIGGIYPQDGTKITQVLQRAIQVINRDVMPPGFSIKIQWRNGGCQEDRVLRNVIEYFNAGKIFGILGPACSETIQPIAGISRYLNIPIISYAAEAPVFNQDVYPYFFRTVGSNRQYEDVFIEFFKIFKWRRFATITEEGQKSTEYIINMEKKIKKDNVNSIVDIKVTKQMNPTDIKNNLMDLQKKRVKVVIAHVRPELVEVILCEALALGMTYKNNYVWFLPSSPSTNSSRCSPEEIQEALQGHFSFIHKPFNKSSEYIDNFMINNSLCELPDRKFISGCNYFGFAFDALLTYAKAAQKFSLEDRKALSAPDKRNLTKKFSELIWETDFEGVSGRVKFFKGNSRITNITILQWFDEKYNIVGEYSPNITVKGQQMTTETGTMTVNTTAIAWKSTPTDGAFDCNFSVFVKFFGADCDSENLTMVIMILTVFLVIICSASFIFWKRRYDSKLRQSAKVMRNFGIDILSPTSAIYNTLDKWEIAKESIVINRRLGEGEFGTVFGGEAKFPIYDDWIAVAIKSLKSGATNESKLDFLSEAEAMKRFNHENVVKLLGVSLQTEPIYTVMEYMLYGDLKTFLLARRHMIHEKINDDSDIHPKRLTSYALGIAEALKYLGENNFVHRDVACRNVLISADRVAKLGDFGLARSMFGNDYYRYNRKGLLPVRWMAPESLAFSVFTPASDIWSFGVLLYEIITFGSFPYQGLTNNQAYQCIVNKKILTIPSDVKPQLESLIKACWNQDAKYRPSASDIIALMEHLPLLVSPCLDVPISSVELHENNEPINVDLLAKMGLKKIKPPVIAQMSTINNLDYKKTDDNGLLIPMETMNVYPIEEEEDDMITDLPPPVVPSSSSSSTSSSTASSSSSSSSTANNSDAASEMYKYPDVEDNEDYCSTSPLLNNNNNNVTDKSPNGTYTQLSRPNDLRKSEHGH